MHYERQHLAILKSRMAESRRRMQIIMGPRQVGKSTVVFQYCDGIDTPTRTGTDIAAARVIPGK